MQKIPTLFKRDPKNPNRVTRIVDPDCEWVLDGRGVATVKYDGTACAVIDGRLYKRHQHRADKGAPPQGWIHWSLDPSQHSGHGWLPVIEGDSSSRWHLEAWEDFDDGEGTYELVGPKVQGFAERNRIEALDLDVTRHHLLPHGDDLGCLEEPERTFDALATFFAEHAMEGIVWHHPDGRKAKIKARDFGVQWPR